MPLGTPLKTFEHKYFFSMIDRDDPQVIPDYFAQNIENWLIRNRGQLEMRDGITARGASPAADNLGSGVLYRANGTKHFVRVINGAANTSKFQYSVDGSTWTDISGGGSRTSDRVWSFVQANNNLYGVNGTDTPIKYDASTITTVAAIPNGTAIEWWKNFLWILGVSGAPDRVYFSDASDPETFGGSSFINVNLGDQSVGTGLKGTSGTTSRLYVTKSRSVWYITGSGALTFSLGVLTYEHGIASHQSLVEVGNDVWGIDLEGNIRSLYRTPEDNPFSALMSKDIQTTIAGLNKSALYKSTSVYFNNYAMFFVANGVDNYNSLTLVWDTLANEGKGGWIKFTGWNIARASVFTETVPKLFLHDSRTSNGQTYEWTGASDNGISITAKYETKIYDHGFPEREKKWKFSYQFAPPVGDVNLRYYVSIDRYYYTKIADVNLLGTGNKLLGVNWTLGQDRLGVDGFVKTKINYTDQGGDNTGYTVQTKLEAESSSSKLKIRMFSSHYRVKDFDNMGVVTKPVTFVDGTVPYAAQFNGDFDTIYDEFNGNITDSNIRIDAAINPLKIATTGDDLEAFRQVGTSPLERWYTSAISGTFTIAGAVVAVNTLSAIPFVESRGGTLDRIGYRVGTGGAAGAVGRCGIYKATSQTNLYPNQLIVDSGEFDNTSSGLKSTVLSEVLSRDTLYWFVYLGGVNSATLGVVNSAFFYSILGIPSTLTGAVGLHLQVSQGYAALPSTFPSGATVASGTPPLVAVRYSA